MPGLSKFDEERRRVLHLRAQRALAAMGAEEDAAITADALSDPDNPPIDDADGFMTWDEYLGKYHGKTTVTLDRDVVDLFRKAGEDWEDRINTALRSVAPGK